MKFKSTGSGRVSGQHPNAPLGAIRDGLYTYEVTGIPEATSTAEVQRLLDGTTTFLAESAGRFSFSFAELGVGHILQAARP